MKQAKELLQRVPNANMNTRDVLGDWINDARNVLWKFVWECSQPR